MGGLGAAERLLDVRTIYLEPAVGDFARKQEILERFADAERIEVDSHWQIPSCHGNEGNVRYWTRMGGYNVRYRGGLKRKMVKDFLALVEQRLPSCQVRYASERARPKGAARPWKRLKPKKSEGAGGPQRSPDRR